MLPSIPQPCNVLSRLKGLPSDKKVASIRPSREPGIALRMFLESAVLGVKSHQIRHRFSQVDRGPSEADS